MSWGARSSTATSRVSSTQRSKAKSKSDLERGVTKDPFIGWEGEDSYLQVESIDIESWGKRHNSQPNKVPKEIKSKVTSDNGAAISYLPWDVYLCWTYTKCNTISDYEEFVENSLSWQFKPEDEITTIADDEKLDKQPSLPKLDNKLPPVAVELGLGRASNADSKDTKNKSAITNKQINLKSKDNCIDLKTEDAVASPDIAAGASHVTTTTDTRHCISHSAPSLRTLDLDAVESDPRASSAADNDTYAIKAGQLNNQTSKSKSTKQSPSMTKDRKNSPGKISNADKHELSINLTGTDTRSQSSSSNILIDPERFGVDKYVGFELPNTARVSLGDLLSNTPRLHRRLGTAKGRDPQVYAALHGTEQRPQTPDIIQSTIAPSSPKSRATQDTELPPVKVHRSPRSECGSITNGSALLSASGHGSAFASSAHGSASGSNCSTQSSSVIPQEFPADELLPSVQSKTSNGWEGRVALLSYNHKTSSNSNIADDTSGSIGQDIDAGMTTSSGMGSSPRVSEHGDRRVKQNQGKAVFFLQGNSTGLTLYSGPTTLQSAIDKCDESNESSVDIIIPHRLQIPPRPGVQQPWSREEFVRKAHIASQVLGQKISLFRTRGPPGFRPHGQKTPLHRAMENTHKKLHGQHYHLFSQQQASQNNISNYGQYKDKHRRGTSAVSSSSQKTQNISNHEKHGAPGGADINANTWPQQLSGKMSHQRSTTIRSAPSRRINSTTNAVTGGATFNRHLGNIAASDYNSNSIGKRSRRASAQSYLGGDERRRYHSTNDINSNFATLRTKPVHR